MKGLTILILSSFMSGVFVILCAESLDYIGKGYDGLISISIVIITLIIIYCGLGILEHKGNIRLYDEKYYKKY